MSSCGQVKKGSVRIPFTARVFFIEVPSMQCHLVRFELGMRKNLPYLLNTFNYIENLENVRSIFFKHGSKNHRFGY